MKDRKPVTVEEVRAKMAKLAATARAELERRGVDVDAELAKGKKKSGKVKLDGR